MPADLHQTEQLAVELERLSAQLHPEGTRDPGGHAAPSPTAPRLAALLPAEIAAGPVAVAVWQTGDSSDDASVESRYELVRFDGTRIVGSEPLREALALLAMTEAVSSALDPEDIRQAIDLLLDWRSELAVPVDSSAQSPRDDKLDADLDAQLWAAIELLQLLEQAIGDPDAPARLASARRLDQLGSLTLRLHEAWATLERSGERWSEQAESRSDADGLLVQGLWTALGAGRRGPLREPLAIIVERGRQAGDALADEVLATK